MAMNILKILKYLQSLEVIIVAQKLSSGMHWKEKSDITVKVASISWY